ncbi:MAG TPA: hypothetical protein VFX28_03590, partial [Methylomirabilota bacterium]|nr:hypothetical protein [Methylomirabilota bacterium]
MRRPRALALAAALAVVAAPAAAAEWGLLIPGTTTMPEVRQQYGAPTRTDSPRVDGVETAQWTYEGAQAPVGMKRLVVDFGLAGPGGLRKDLLRTFRLEPKPGAFNRQTIVRGWGTPTRVGAEGETPVFVYQQGLIVYFEKDGWRPRLMVFTPPQPPPPEQRR